MCISQIVNAKTLVSLNQIISIFEHSVEIEPWTQIAEKPEIGLVLRCDECNERHDERLDEPWRGRGVGRLLRCLHLSLSSGIAHPMSPSSWKLTMTSGIEQTT